MRAQTPELEALQSGYLGASMNYFQTRDRDTLLPDFDAPTVEHVTLWTDARGFARWSVRFN
jgi:hypothetical protein